MSLFASGVLITLVFAELIESDCAVQYLWCYCDDPMGVLYHLGTTAFAFIN